ncbi:hypothetical protein Ssi02_54880 [Sinosporangium siamense]|uniref:Uncharacterized protein n=1 Tax=Sinosporangium siamense TaxID=1367973 RepID=A0A919RK17_9ACTN|nr:hypothetical protein Ssi02_54880 [Sinosporangium siamense]
MDGYWESIAIVAPVIGLAIVVEMRLLLGEWQKNRYTPRLKTVLSSPFVAYMLCAVFVEYEALVQLRSAPPTREFATFAEITVGGGLAALILGPLAIQLIKMPRVAYYARFALTPLRSVKHLQSRQILRRATDQHLRLRIRVRESEMAAALNELRIAHHALLAPREETPEELIDVRRRLKTEVAADKSAIGEEAKVMRQRADHLTVLRRQWRRALVEPAPSARKRATRPTARRVSYSVGMTTHTS